MSETVLDTEGGTASSQRTAPVQGPTHLVNEALLDHDEEQFGRGTLVAELSCTSRLDPAVGRRRPSPDALAGRGLWLVNQLCDLVELRSVQGGAAVRLHVRDGLDEPAVGMTSAGSAV
jgi:hypothetical protein